VENDQGIALGSLMPPRLGTAGQKWPNSNLSRS